MTKQDEHFFPVADMDAWAEFWSRNAEELVGGGAAPLIRVGFVD